MEPVSRRTFIKRAGTVAAVAGVAAVAPASIAGAQTKSSLADARVSEDEATSKETIVAHVLEGGEITLFVGDREVTMHDRSVASRIIRATR